jgi:hypothetical protein
MPPHPVSGKTTRLRAHTRKDANGAFWCADMGGALFKFYPAEDRVEAVGINWGKEGKYVANMSMSPGGRYIYYLPGADRMAHEYGTPVVQYDTKTGRKKVLAFLRDYYLEKYGYLVLGTYGVELDKKGESLFFYMDGRFTPADQFRFGERRTGMFHLKIPASEHAKQAVQETRIFRKFARWLERQPQQKAERPAVVEGVADDAEVRGGERAAGFGELGGVEEVQRFGPQMQRHLSAEGPVA